MPLIEHVALEHAGDFIPREIGLRLDNVDAGTLLDDVGVEKCLMADHAREGQTVDRTRCAIVIPSPEIRVAGDGDDLLKVVHLLQSVRTEAGADGDDVRDALGPMHSEVEGHHSAERSPNHGV